MLVKKIKAKHDAMANTKLPPEEVAPFLERACEDDSVRARVAALVHSLGRAAGVLPWCWSLVIRLYSACIPLVFR